MFTVYAKSGCGFCDRLVDFMSKNNIQYTKLMLGEDYSVESFLNKFGRGTTFPQVVFNDDNLGGMKDTVRYLVENSYVQ